MTIRRMICVVSVVLGLAFQASSFAIPSVEYTYAMSEGKKAFLRHNDGEAIRYFLQAQRMDPSADEPNQYLQKISEQQPPVVSVESSTDLGLAYQDIMHDAQTAFDRGDQARALDLFYKAHLVRPQAEKPLAYINLIKRQREKRVVAVGPKKILPVRQTSARKKAAPSSREENERDFLYQDLMSKALKAFQQGDRVKALEFFNKAHLVRLEEQKPIEYIDLIKRAFDEQILLADREDVAAAVPHDVKKSSAVSLPVPVVAAIPADEPVQQETGGIPAVVNIPDKISEKPASAVVAVVPVKEPIVSETALVAGFSSAVDNAGAVQSRKKVKIVETVNLADLMKTGDRPTLRFEMGTSVRVEGRNIKRFMTVDEGVVEVYADGRDHIKITSLRRGMTFLHIWDDAGRSTVLLEIVFPVDESDRSAEQMSVERSDPFRFHYSNDWGAYYQGPDAATMKRSARPDFRQTYAMDGDTPLGVLDASQTRSGYGDMADITTYTLGLTGVPVPGTKEFNLRIFDAARSLSPLTFPGTRLRGAFADVNLFENKLGVSVSHGKQQSAFSYFVPGYSSTKKIYADALRMTLFPKDRDNQVSLNYVKGYGPDYEDYLTGEAYSIEARKKLDRLALNAELARDGQQAASIAGARWDDGVFHSMLNVRDINKDYTTVLAAPSDQGEAGATWTTDVIGERATVGGMVDVYRDRLYANPEHPEAFNYDTEAHMNVVLDEDRKTSFDTNVRYVDTPGDVSPRRFASSSSRLSRNISLWSNRTATVFAGGGYQRSRYAYTATSEYDRLSAICGAQIPLIADMTYFANYEYSWLNEPATGLDSNPNVFNMGVNYTKELTPKLTGTCGITYRNEEDMRGTNSFLAGEDSVALATGLSYSPKDDVNLFVDSRLRSVWSQISDNPSYHDLDLRFGMRMSWGSPFSWDPVGGITGFVFKDKNGDGKFAPGEDVGLTGVKVKVGNTEVVTDERGWYRTSVNAKKVIVMPDLETVPPGFIFSTAPFFKVDIFQGINRRVDFGMTTQSGIYGIVYLDKNGNGTPDRDDQFVGRVQLVLDGKTRQASDARGAYFFKNVASGKHTVTIDMKFVPMDMIPGVKIKNEISIAEGTTYVLHIPMKPNLAPDQGE